MYSMQGDKGHLQVPCNSASSSGIDPSQQILGAPGDEKELHS